MAEDNTIRVLVVDDHLVIRLGLRSIRLNSAGLRRTVLLTESEEPEKLRLSDWTVELQRRSLVRDFLFVFNPNYDDLSQKLVLDESVGLSGRERFTIMEL